MKTNLGDGKLRGGELVRHPTEGLAYLVLEVVDRRSQEIVEDGVGADSRVSGHQCEPPPQPSTPLLHELRVASAQQQTSAGCANITSIPYNSLSTQLISPFNIF